MTGMGMPTFTLQERDRRWDLSRLFMNREGVDALLVFGEHEDAGPGAVAYDTWFTNGRPGTTVIFPRAGEPISLAPMPLYNMDHMESSRRGDVMWIPPHNLRAFRDSGTVAETLEDLGLSKATIGVIGLEPYPPWHPEGLIPYQLWNSVLSHFPDIEFKPVALAFSRLTMALSEEEIAVVRHCAGIGDAMAHAMVDAAGPGVSESEVYAAGMSAGFARGAVPSPMHFWSGPDPVASGWPQWGYRPQAPRILQNGDVIRAEVFCNFGGRHTQHQVMIAIGEVAEELQRAADVARAAYDVGLKAFRPGRTFAEAVDEVRKPLEAADGWEFGPAVHGLNPLMALSRCAAVIRRLAGAEAYPAVPDAPTVFGDVILKPGMTFAFEPNYAFGRHLAYIGGTIIVGDDEPIELNPYTARILRAGTTTLARI